MGASKYVPVVKNLGNPDFGTHPMLTHSRRYLKARIRIICVVNSILLGPYSLHTGQHLSRSAI